jgi:hypothetical protein
MIRQQKGPLFPAALRWEVSTSGGNDASGRNVRVLLEMVRRTGICHPSKGQAAMHQAQLYGLETEALHHEPQVPIWLASCYH